MNFLSRLFGKKKPEIKVEDETLLNENVCPFCWGYQEYDNHFVEYVKDQTKSNINHEHTHKKAFVQQFIETHVTGIHLKREEEHSYCPSCDAKYKHDHSKAN